MYLKLTAREEVEGDSKGGGAHAKHVCAEPGEEVLNESEREARTMSLET